MMMMTLRQGEYFVMIRNACGQFYPYFFVQNSHFWCQDIKAAWVLPGREKFKPDSAEITRMKKSIKDRKRKENKKKIAKTKFFLRKVYPTICIVFVILFWVIGLYHYWLHGDGTESHDYDESEGGHGGH